MSITTLSFVLLCITVFLPKTEQIVSQKFRIISEKNSTWSEEHLLGVLNVFEQKLADNTFTDEDMVRLYLVKQYVQKLIEIIRKRRMKEQTVYWFTRQGR